MLVLQQKMLASLLVEVESLCLRHFFGVNYRQTTPTSCRLFRSIEFCLIDLGNAKPRSRFRSRVPNGLRHEFHNNAIRSRRI